MKRPLFKISNIKAFLLIVTISATSVSLISCSGKEENKDSEVKTSSTSEERAENKSISAPIPMRNGRLHINHIGPLYKVFNDSNPAQLTYARKLGIEPVTDLRSAFRTSKPLVEIRTSDHYLVDSLTHSLPYLVPQAARLLDDIGAAFIDSLKRRSAYGYRIKVTSLLPTPSTVRSLRRVNRNASDSSTHQYGTTFDLSYSKFQVLDSTLRLTQEDLKNLLGEVLMDFRNQGRCMVKYERKTACYHITVTK